MIIPKSTGYKHCGVIKIFEFVAEYICGDSKPLDASNSMLHKDSDAGLFAVLFFDSFREFSCSRFSDWH